MRPATRSTMTALRAEQQKRRARRGPLVRHRHRLLRGTDRHRLAHLRRRRACRSIPAPRRRSSASIRTGASPPSFGVASHGQGLETTLAQVVAEHLGARFEDIRVVHGDSAAVAGRHRHLCEPQRWCSPAARRRSRRKPCARRCSTPPRICSKPRPPISIAADGKIFGRRHRSVDQLPRDRPRGLFRRWRGCRRRRARSSQRPRPTIRSSAPRPAATHVAAVEIDPETYEVRVDRYVVAEDCGRLINPLIVDGQVHGGVAQGIGAALYEEVIYDEHGQILTASLVDYLVPSALRDAVDAGACISKARRRRRSAAFAAWAKAAPSARRRRSPTRSPTRWRRSVSRSTSFR